MDIPRGMVAQQPIALSEAQQAQHNIPGQQVTGTVLDGRGDGWIENIWPNRHLVGSLTQMRRRNGHYYHEFVPIDNALAEAEQVQHQISAELKQLAGGHDTTGLWEEGELERLRASQARLFDWLTLMPEDKDDTKKAFADMADARAGATNRFNLTAGSIANRARELKDRTGRDNPSAILAMVLKLEKQLVARHGELAYNLSVNHLRRGRLQHEWLFHENQVLAGTHGIMERLLASQSEEDLYALKLMAPNVRFRVRPFNLLAYEIAQTGGEVSDEQVVTDAMAAMQFDRFKNYLLSPFRRITATPKQHRAKTAATETEPINEALRRRTIALYSMDARGATGRLVDRLIPLSETVLHATRLGDKERARKAGRAFKWLVNYHCLPNDDPESEVWYSRQLR